MKFAFIHEHLRQFPVDLVCRVLEVSRSGYYAWQAAAAERDHPPSSSLGRRDSPGPPGEPRHLRLTARAARARGPWRQLLGEHGGQADAARGNSLQNQAAVRRPHHRQPTWSSDCSQSPGPGVRRAASRSDLGGRHHLHSDAGRLALPGGRDRSLHPQDRGLGHRRFAAGRAGL